MSSEDIFDAITAVQTGDFDSVEELVVKNRLVSVNSKDTDGCTLLHWAAINNRVQITNLLVTNGALHVPGGILNETPLHWALRKQFY